jgi:dolichyl-phosphate-mannose--protein O-mannosyl transferase
LFYPATLAVFSALGAVVAAVARPALRERVRALVPPNVARAVVVLAGGWLALLAPWMVGRGTYTFWYHYMPSYGLALVLLAGVVAHLERTRERDVATFVAVALAFFVYFAPVWAEFRVSLGAANARLVFPGWKP